METLSTFLGLISKTQGRDKVLRLFQFSCLHAIQHKEKGARFKVYQQMRMTRKLVRFLRTLDYLAKIKRQLPELKKSLDFLPMFFRHLTNILQNIFAFLYFINDHKVCLTELNVLAKSPQYQITYRNSYKYYLLQNMFGILNNIFCIIASIIKSSSEDGKESNEMKVKKLIRVIKHYTFDLIRCCLDCVIALFYWKHVVTPKTAGVIGVLSTIMAIMQSLEQL